MSGRQFFKAAKVGALRLLAAAAWRPRMIVAELSEPEERNAPVEPPSGHLAAASRPAPH